MEDLVAKGLVKSIGVSNWNSAQLDRTVKNAKIIPAVNQVCAVCSITKRRSRNLHLNIFTVLSATNPISLKIGLDTS